ncbi:MAG: hypothetical protein M1826_004066 [Phylliscum demangeonii]|nr:MAG: hypothetical protein M1826_004066 [Phylliscum demangeonii]
MPSHPQKTFRLNTGASIPAIGFGTWQDVHAQEDAVLEALQAGYRHIDTARVYGTEAAIGKAIKKSGVPRDQLFLTTKLWCNSMHPDDVESALDASLADLGTGYVDLYLIHWPAALARGPELFPKGADGKAKTLPEVDYRDTYLAMEKVVKTGKTKAIGVSNFSQAEVERVLETATIVPAVHQLEMHPWLQQKAFADFHRAHDIHITQYSPFANQNDFYGSQEGKLIDDPLLQELGQKYHKTAAQVALAWGISQGHSVIPKSKTPARIRSNFQADFPLDAEDMAKIASMDRKLRLCDSTDMLGRKFFVGLEGARN